MFVFSLKKITQTNIYKVFCPLDGFSKILCSPGHKPRQVGSTHGKPFQFHVRMNELPARVREQEPPPYEPMLPK